MQFIYTRLHPERRVWVEESIDYGIDTWMANAQEKCDILREKLYEDIELGVFRLPKCCAAKKCDGSRGEDCCARPAE